MRGLRALNSYSWQWIPRRPLLPVSLLSWKLFERKSNEVLSIGKRPSPRVQRILKFIKLRKAGVPIAEVPWQAYQLANREFDELQRWLKQDEELWGYVEDKVR